MNEERKETLEVILGNFYYLLLHHYKHDLSAITSRMEWAFKDAAFHAIGSPKMIIPERRSDILFSVQLGGETVLVVKWQQGALIELDETLTNQAWNSLLKTIVSSSSYILRVSA